MAITLGDAFQNWGPDAQLNNSPGCTVDGGIIPAIEPNLFKDRSMLPGITYATDIDNFLMTANYAVAFIRKLDKIPVKRGKLTDANAFRVKPTQTDGNFLEIKCNDILSVDEVVSEIIDVARVSGKTADKVALASESFDEQRELQFLSYFVNGGASADPTDVGAPASANTTKSDETTVVNNIIDDYETLRKASARPDTLIISPDTEGAMFKRVSERLYYRSPSEAELLVLGNEYAGTLFSGKVKMFTSNSLGVDNSALADAETGDTSFDFSDIEYFMYDHNTFSIVNLLMTVALVDYRSQVRNSSLIQITSVCGGRIRNSQKAIIKRFA